MADNYYNQYNRRGNYQRGNRAYRGRGGRGRGKRGNRGQINDMDGYLSYINNNNNNGYYENKEEGYNYNFNNNNNYYNNQKNYYKNKKSNIKNIDDYFNYINNNQDDNNNDNQNNSNNNDTQKNFKKNYKNNINSMDQYFNYINQNNDQQNNNVSENINNEDKENLNKIENKGEIEKIKNEDNNEYKEKERTDIKRRGNNRYLRRSRGRFIGYFREERDEGDERGTRDYQEKEEKRGRFPGFRGKLKNNKIKGNDRHNHDKIDNVNKNINKVFEEKEDYNSLLDKEEKDIINFSNRYFINSIKNNDFKKDLLNDSQLKAFELLTTKNLFMVQGGPGTGKTYLATIISNLFLQNNNSKILIISSSNQSLSQLVFNIIEYRDSIKRIKKEKNKNLEVIDIDYLETIEELIYLEKIKLLSSLIFDQRNKTEVVLSQLRKKVSDDFYDILKSVTGDIKLERNNKINNCIYQFWKNIGQTNNDPTEIIFEVLGSNLNEENGINLFEKIYSKFKRCFKNNIKLIEYLNKSNGLNIQNLQNINNFNEEPKEQEIDQKNKYNKNTNEININFNNEDKNEILTEKEDLFDKKEDDIKSKNSIIINKKIFELLINTNSKQINFFYLGPLIINEIIKYMKIIIIDKYLQKTSNTKIVATSSEIFKQNYRQINNHHFNCVLIEEAEEVIESHILSLLTKCTNQIILFSDLKKLKTNENEFGKNDIKNIPLIKRLINNNIPLVNLEYQRRMKPIFIEFIKIIYGEDNKDIFKDYLDVNDNEKVKGIEKDMFIIKHNEKETINDNDLNNVSNMYEAKYLSKLAAYLLRQGYKKNEIVILTFYDSQVDLIIKYSNKLGLNNLKVKNIDNYKGEECSIVLLSLVRSNDNYDIGALNSFNKVYTAFSRAKIGFYIIGNIDIIVKGDSLLKEKYDNNKDNNFDLRMLGVWEKINIKAKILEILGEELILVCQNHKKRTVIKTYKDFDKCPEGGCLEKCKKRRKCGHGCKQYCHGYDCNEKNCETEVMELNPNCKLGIHKYRKKCYEEFGRCEERVDKKLKCNHIINCECYKDIKLIICDQKCEKKLPCGHIKKDCLCFQNINDIKCTAICNRKLPCGHLCQGLCCQCLKGTLHTKCSVKCGRMLPCGHICKQKCSFQCLCSEDCPNECPHSNCSKKCCEICIDCKEICIIGCKHSKCEKNCYELCDRKPCNERCDKIMKCGHQCYGLCGERCPEVCRECNPKEECFINDFFYGIELEEKDLIYKTKCGHLFEVKGFDKYMKIKPDKNIQMYTCPQCKSLLIWEPRYQNIIKNIFIDIQKIKIMSLDKNLGKDDKTFYLKSKILVEEILNKTFRPKEKTDILITNKMNEQKINIFELLPKKNMLSNQRIFEYDHYDLENKLPIIYNLCKNEFKDENDFNSRIITTYNLLTLAEKFLGIEYYFYSIKSQNLEKKERIFLDNFNVVKEYFKNFESQFDNFFFKNLKRKIDNMLYYSIVKLIRNSQINYNQLTNDYNIISTEEIEKSYFYLELDLKKLYKTNYIDKEVLNLLNSLGTKWYKCPNNHLYTVGECGRPMEESICPQCNIKIGGRNHIPATGNEEVNLNQEMKNINNNANNNQKGNNNLNLNQNNYINQLRNNLNPNQNNYINQLRNNLNPNQNNVQDRFQNDFKNNDKNNEKKNENCNIL